MSKLFKLFTAVLVLGFLVGCGGGGDSSSNKKLTLSKVTSFDFPALSVSQSLNSTESYKRYKPISAAKINDFNASLSAIYTPYTFNATATLYEVNTDLLAVVNPSSNALQVYLANYDTTSYTHNDDLWTNELPSIDANVDYVYIGKAYNGNLLSEFSSYYSKFSTANGWSKTYSSPSKWQAAKEVDGLIYYWVGTTNSTMGISTFGVYKK